MAKSEALKMAFEKFCKAKGLKKSRDYEAGRAALIVRKGKYVLETTCVSESMSKYSPGAVGFEYPAGVKGLSDEEMTSRLGALAVSS